MKREEKSSLEKGRWWWWWWVSGAEERCRKKRENDCPLFLARRSGSASKMGLNAWRCWLPHRVNDGAGDEAGWEWRLSPSNVV